jgi:hypothetical protein
VTEPTEKPVWKTGTLWGVLGVLLGVGTLGAATFVYGVTVAVLGDPYGVIALGIGGVVAALSFLFMAGILYRVDRYRGVTERRVELFE